MYGRVNSFLLKKQNTGTYDINSKSENVCSNGSHK